MLKRLTNLLLLVTLPIVALPSTFANTPTKTDKVNAMPTNATPTDKTNTANPQTPAQTFLEENKKREGVVTLPSGLQYKIIKEGSGQAPGPSDIVTVHYRGTLLNGQEFDSSYRRNEPATFPVNGVIAGWQEALKLMKPGAKWILYIPSQLAYGEKGAGQLIPPHSLLIFEVELLSVKPSVDTDQDGLVEQWEELD